MTPPSDTPDDAIDEALIESFPASDPPANTGETGVRIGRVETGDEPIVQHDTVTQQFAVTIGAERAYLQYNTSPQATTISHTEVPPTLGGRGLGGTLARAALAWARSTGRPVRITCPFVREYVKKHPELLEAR